MEVFGENMLCLEQEQIRWIDERETFCVLVKEIVLDSNKDKQAA